MGGIALLEYMKVWNNIQVMIIANPNVFYLRGNDKTLVLEGIALCLNILTTYSTGCFFQYVKKFK